jgi:ribosomal-protein-alanine N-acetyltransferase
MKILETERLILREMDESDDAFIFDLLNQPSFIKYIGNRNVHSRERAREIIRDRYVASYREHGYGLWAVELKIQDSEFNIQDSEIRNPKSEIRNSLIGMCGFVRRDGLPYPDIGFAFLPEFEGKGYAHEAARATMRYGWEDLQFKRVLAITTLDNESSIRLLRKLGFKDDGLIILPEATEELRLFSAET